MTDEQRMEKQDWQREKEVLGLLGDIFMRYKKGVASKDDMAVIQKASPIINKGDHRLLNEQETSAMVDKLYKRIIGKINSGTAMSDAVPEKTRRRIPIFPLGSRIRQYAAAACVALALAGAGYFFLLENKKELISEACMRTSVGEMQTETLPDGTIVHLNRGSELTYDKMAFNKHMREVKLSGEAFFEVAKNKEKPFYIHTKGIVVHVTGTAFTVTSYNQMKNTSVWVKNGTVEVSLGQSLLGKLTKNKRLVYDGFRQTAKITNEDWDKGAGWLDGKLVLADADADELKTRLEQFYGIELNMDNSARRRVKNINAVFLKKDGIQGTMESIALSCNIKFKIQGNQVAITAN